MNEKKSGNKFLVGFFVGILLTVFTAIIAVGLVVAVSGNAGKIAMLYMDVFPGKQATTEQVDSIDWKGVSDKSEYIAEMINEIYMGDIDPKRMEEYVYKGMLASLNDPYTTYYTAEEFAEMNESDEGLYCGAGFLVTQVTSTNLVQVLRVYDGSSAKEQGILPGDMIIKVDGEDVTALDLSSVVAKVRGEEGTKVVLTMYRESTGEYIDFDIERRVVTVQTIDYKMFADNVGYIKITEFDQPTDDQFIEAVNTLEKQGMKSLIIDLRDNPGGLVDEACTMIDRLVPEGVITYTEDKYGNRREYMSDAKCLNVPMAILMNADSASASEIFAGALRDYGMATIVGTKSFGKGIVQTIIPIGDGSAVKITFSKYFSPNGNNIHGVGIEPDVVCELTAEQYKDFRMYQLSEADDPQIQAAIGVLTK